jgi:glycosyltransferase involved in cell wall biosynthesis
MTSRVVGHVVTKDEVHRYLEPCLSWLRGMVDVVHVFDDRSSDDTPVLAAELGALVDVRLRTVASFMDNEMSFRQAGWTAMTRAAEVSEGDWVLSIDADEFLVSSEGPESERVAAVIQDALTYDIDIVGFAVNEVFGYSDGRPTVRGDGFWGNIFADRLTRWSPHARFSAKRANGRDCGSIPFVNDIPRPDQLVLRSRDLSILHYGYAAGEHGHNKAHVRSILQRPKVAPWTGRIPDGL